LRLPGIFDTYFNSRKRVCKGVGSKAGHFVTPFVYEKRFHIEEEEKKHRHPGHTTLITKKSKRPNLS
jgi:hypothetical protein